MSDVLFLRHALRLAREAQGMTSPNPAVGAVLVKQGKVIGRGRTAPPGGPHAEIGAIRAAGNQSLKGATLYVSLEPCCTHGRTPPCTDAIIAAGIKHVVVGAVDPNPNHAGEGFEILQRAGVKVRVAATGFGFRPGPESEKLKSLAAECARLNEAFNHWIVHGTPFVTVKAAMTLDGKIATAAGESKWITGERAREFGMQLRWQHDAILVGVNTILADDPSLTVRGIARARNRPLCRIILDTQARTPLLAKVVCDEFAASTTIMVGDSAPKKRIAALARRVKVVMSSPLYAGGKIELNMLLKNLGAEQVTSLLVEGGGEVNASFLLGGWAHRVAFFYAPKILGGRNSRPAVAGDGVKELQAAIKLSEPKWRHLGDDLLLLANVESAS